VRGVQADPGAYPGVWPLGVSARTNWISAQGEPTVTLLLRHGQTPMSVQKRYSGRTDAPLTDAGVRQAAAAAKRLASADFGAWEGLTFAEVRARWPSEMARWLADPSVAPPGGESFAQVSERVTAALHRVLASQAHQTVLIVSHVTPIKTLVAAALLAPPAALYRMHLDVAALCEVDWYADGPAVLRSFNDTAHLSQ